MRNQHGQVDSQAVPGGEAVQTLKADGCHLLLVDPMSGTCINQPHSNGQGVLAIFVPLNKNEIIQEVVLGCYNYRVLMVIQFVCGRAYSFPKGSW